MALAADMGEFSGNHLYFNGRRYLNLSWGATPSGRSYKSIFVYVSFTIQPIHPDGPIFTGAENPAGQINK